MREGNEGGDGGRRGEVGKEGGGWGNERGRMKWGNG